MSTPIFNKETMSLFDSILATESQHAIDADIHKHANRVGITLKLTYARDLLMIREQFVAELTALVQTTLSKIDMINGVVPKTEED